MQILIERQSPRVLDNQTQPYDYSGEEFYQNHTHTDDVVVSGLELPKGIQGRVEIIVVEVKERNITGHLEFAPLVVQRYPDDAIDVAFVKKVKNPAGMTSGPLGRG